MSQPPFDKVIVSTDHHFGRRNGSAEANQDNLDFLEWKVQLAKERGIKTAILCGDYNNNRHSIQVASLDAGIRGYEILSEGFETVYSLTGNHDLVFRNNRDVTSLEYTKFIPNIIPIFDPITIGEGYESVTFLPWLTEDDRDFVNNIRSRYVFGHLELNGGWLMNAKAVVPDREDAIDIDDFKGIEYVFTGHYHIRQRKKNVIYIGNIFPFDYSDSWDEDRGVMILEWGKEPEFVKWPKQPLFRVFNLSDALEDPDRYFCDRLSAKVHIDNDMTHEEVHGVKEEFMRRYDLRKLEMVPVPVASIGEHTPSGNVHKTVDQRVLESLDGVESNTIRPEQLKSIYSEIMKG